MTRRRRVVVLAAAAAALLGGTATVTHLAQPRAAAAPSDLFEALRGPQQPTDLGADAGLPQEVVRGSVRRAGAADAVTYWVGTTADQRVCLSAVGPSGGGGTCTLRGPVRPDDVLSVELAHPAVTAWLVPEDADTDDLLPRGSVALAPGLWVAPPR